MSAAFNLDRLFADVVIELARAREKHPRDKAIPFTDYPTTVLGAILESARLSLANAVATDTVTHHRIINCELFEALAETDPAKRRAELVQVIACCIRAIEDLETP